MRPLLAALALLLVAGCSAAPGDEFTFVAPGGQTKIFYDVVERKKLPAIEGENLLEEGKTIKVADYRDQVVVLNLWGAWCVACRTEADDLERVHQQTKDSGVRFLGIDVKDPSRTAPADFFRDRGITYPSIYDPAGRTLLKLRNYPRNIVPSTIVLDRQHRVAAVLLTELLDTDLLPVVQRITAEPR
ncbi:TlpA family protein disulfide reductase [Allokutzneria sp. A3M-2-11 16]|uniref:TlpA disulfide reductase family protein n=1 Tax=Allokutzneria sp. A3M-2-11 16 TaxID=2962043 RepID=UPI0020B7CCD1|nr:TlpA disulfide reductase family protein [Allokutzneria sp. A3M-2-11 16]MCP3798991.1 TlpA family protein disulfide reductase [Allokutzneria sp. A3M-2-11 16]